MKLSPAFQLLLTAATKAKALKNVNLNLPLNVDLSECGNALKKKLQVRPRKTVAN